MIEVRRLVPENFDHYYETRLASLVQCPAAFATDADAWRNASQETIMKHLQVSEEGTESPILGAWTEESLVGLLGMNREERPSVRHKAGLWGLFVMPDHQNQGVGRALVAEMIAVAKTMPELRQLRALVPAEGTAPFLMEKMGFERFGFERDAKRVDGQFHDQVYFSYRLRGSHNLPC